VRGKLDVGGNGGFDHEFDGFSVADEADMQGLAHDTAVLAGGEGGGELAGLAGCESRLIRPTGKAAAGGVEALDSQGEIPVIGVAPLGGDRFFTGLDGQRDHRGFESGLDGARGIRAGKSRHATHRKAPGQHAANRRYSQVIPSFHRKTGLGVNEGKKRLFSRTNRR
jgi:hypothetical protein